MTRPKKIPPPPPMPDDDLRHAKGSKKAFWVVIGWFFLGGFALIAILLPLLADRIRAPSMGATKGDLGALRSALSIYYGDMEGVYPSTLEALTVGGKYLRSIPSAKVPPHHPNSSAVTFRRGPNDTGGWLYNNYPKDRNFGTVLINCTHTDEKGMPWDQY